MRFVTLVKLIPGKANEFFRIIKSRSVTIPEGIKVISAFLTYGSYDMVLIWEATDISKANEALRRIAESGIVSTETMVAQSIEEFLG